MYTPRQSIAVSTKSCPYDGIPFLSALRPKNKDFTKILNVVPETLRAHPLFLRDQACSEAGEWGVQMRSAENEGRRVTVQAFVFNLFQDSGARTRAL